MQAFPALVLLSLRAALCMRYCVCMCPYELLCQRVNPGTKEQYMGVLTGFGAGARLAGPIWASNLYTIQYGPDILFCLSFAAFAAF